MGELRDPAKAARYWWQIEAKCNKTPLLALTLLLELLRQATGFFDLESLASACQLPIAQANF